MSLCRLEFSVPNCCSAEPKVPRADGKGSAGSFGKILHWLKRCFELTILPTLDKMIFWRPLKNSENRFPRYTVYLKRTLIDSVQWTNGSTYM